MKAASIIVVALIVAIATVGTNGAQLPGAPFAVNFTSGYITVNPDYGANLFYWYVDKK